jgi:histidinol phosphatase-like enzyme
MLSPKMRQPFVIFDRDGTLIELVPYLKDEKK